MTDASLRSLERAAGDDPAAPDAFRAAIEAHDEAERRRNLLAGRLVVLAAALLAETTEQDARARSRTREVLDGIEAEERAMRAALDRVV